LTYSLRYIKTFIIIVSSYCLFRVFLVIFLGLLRGSGKEEGDTAYNLVEVYITLYFSDMLFVRVLSKGE
jgi:hypothetical protein